MDQVIAFGGDVREVGAAGADARSDEELIARIARRDQLAMEQLYRRHAARIYRFAFARICDPLAADDIVNDVMMKVWEDAARFRAQSRASTWMLGIAYHLAMDYMRARYRHPTEALDEEMPDSTATDFSAALASAQDAARVRAAMQRLSDEHRAVLHLAFFEDLGYDRIAEILDCPVGTVKSRVFHAKQLLKRYLSE